MFGYVNVFKDELKVKDYMIFRSYYCGLCHRLGKLCSQCSRLGLSYDMTFLAILLSALSPTPIKIKESPCIAHPLHKRKYVTDDPVIDYAAYASAILYYCKMRDDWNDDHSLKALVGILIYRGQYKKALKKYPSLAESIHSHLKDLSNLEKNNSTDIDAAADCFAKITEELFSPRFIGENKRPAAWIGYNIGRWIYIIDAFADLEKDIKSKSYNPFAPSDKNIQFDDYVNNLSENLTVSLTFTLENAASGFNLLKIHKNEEILKNILFLSLKIKQDQILSRNK